MSHAELTIEEYTFGRGRNLPRAIVKEEFVALGCVAVGVVAVGERDDTVDVAVVGLAEVGGISAPVIQFRLQSFVISRRVCFLL